MASSQFMASGYAAADFVRYSEPGSDVLNIDGDQSSVGMASWVPLNLG